ncbi:MAG: polysaccharide deacetylase family protein [Burkholderiales bacterium]|nr:polysaccharide deacetylase family protein [Burkholderiales bacterium]
MSAQEFPDFRWPEGRRLALSLVVNVEEGAEASIADGDKYPESVDELGIAIRKPIRNFPNEGNYRYGINAGAPRVFALLEERGMQATFTACAQALERAPALTARMVAGGHEACSHGYRWAFQYHMDEAAERAYIRKAVESIERTTGTRPYGWLSRYLTTANTRRLLAEEGFRYTMDDFSHDRPFWDREQPRPLVVVPYALDSNDMKFWTDPAFSPDAWARYAIDTFDWLYEEGGSAPRMMSLGVHLRIIGRPGRIGALKRFLDHVAGRDDVWVTTRLAIADHFARAVPRAAA